MDGDACLSRGPGGEGRRWGRNRAGGKSAREFDVTVGGVVRGGFRRESSQRGHDGGTRGEAHRTRSVEGGWLHCMREERKVEHEIVSHGLRKPWERGE